MTHTELLIATQMLFLNNFIEPLCQQVNETLVCLYKSVIKPPRGQGDIAITGVDQEKEEDVALVKKHLVLATCAMFYNHCQAAVEFF